MRKICYYRFMIKAVAGKIVQAVVTLVAIMTLSFFVVELAPGGPLSSEHRVPDSVRVGQYIRLGIGLPVQSTQTCEVIHVTREGRYLHAGDGVAVCKNHGVLRTRISGRLLAVGIRPGESLRPGMVIAAVARPLILRYVSMLVHMTAFDFGVSYESAGTRTVREIIARTAPVTASIGLIALLLALVFGLLSGLFAARHAPLDYTLTTLSTFTLAVPMVVAAPLALYVFAVSTHILPMGWNGTTAGAILPILTLASIYWAVFHRIVLTSTRQFMASPVFASLNARGLRTRHVLMHATRHVLLSLCGLLGPVAASLMTGSVVVEEVFHVPGMARFFVSSALGRDYPVLMGMVYFYALLLVVLNMGSDLLVLALDPRTRRHG